MRSGDGASVFDTDELREVERKRQLFQGLLQKSSGAAPNMGVILEALDLDVKQDFRYCRLRQQDFSGLDLTGWDFSCAILGNDEDSAQNACFDGARVAGATFYSAKVSFSALSRAADWSKEVEAEIRRQVQTLYGREKHLRSKLIVNFGHLGEVNDASFSPDGSRIVTGSDDETARVWDAETGASLATLKGHDGSVGSASFSPDGSRIVTGADDKTARVWDAETGASLATLKGHDYAVESASFSPDGGLIVTGSGDGTARVWDAETGASLATLKGHDGSVRSASFSSDGRRVVTGSGDGTARVWDAETGASLATLKGHDGYVGSASFSPDGGLIVTGSGDGTARVWDAETGASLATLKGHDGSVRSASFSRDGSRIVTASGDETARVWDAETGDCLFAIRAVESSWAVYSGAMQLTRIGADAAPHVHKILIDEQGRRSALRPTQEEIEALING